MTMKERKEGSSQSSSSSLSSPYGFFNEGRSTKRATGRESEERDCEGEGFGDQRRLPLSRLPPSPAS
ncbi:hypothetical protein Hdeb2414_s0007g00257251 [Helianthus debilis subsp. tardiflorus]